MLLATSNWSKLETHAEIVERGSLAGYNAVSQALGHSTQTFPRTRAIGDIIAYANEKMESKESKRNRYTFTGAKYFEHMKKVVYDKY